MTSIPARQLSGEHLGKTVLVQNSVPGPLLAVEHDGRITRVNVKTAYGSHITSTFPDTPVTIEEDQ